MDIPKWKWEKIAIDFVIDFPRSVRVRTTYSLEQLAQIYVREIMQLHGVPASIAAAGTKLYGRRCYSPLYWDEVGKSRILGPELVEKIVEAIRKIRSRIKIVQDRQKSYADKRRKELTFEVGEKVFLKVAPMKGILRFGKKGKLSPKFIGPFEILEKIGNVACRLALPPELSAEHNVFHIFMLRKYISNPNHVVNV
ncbi:uncharacterized protein LOC111380588 [Olea europaea var. sylvestris]|uniref:uncharacterized protein LOC111380588 n=1 Tax=Olea europaea var. sylvestris TaxID=158386 RepID=UPI000C1D4A0D|nr:uncharacterized protein LOC111380588 [Olea europaea var. sylvestris]